MFRVQFTAARLEATVAPGSTILDAARLAGLELESPCNRTGVCGKCRVLLSSESTGRVMSPEHHAISPAERAEGWCLACHATVAGDVEVKYVPSAARDNGAVLQEGKEAGLCHAPFFVKEYVPGLGRTLIYAGQT